MLWKIQLHLVLKKLLNDQNWINPLFSTLTIGELQKLLQRPKELGHVYDFNNLSRTIPNESSSPTAFLHYVIQMANQCLTSIAERQTTRSKYYCSCCSYHQQYQFNIKDERQPLINTINSPNAQFSALLQMQQTIQTQEFSNEDILTVQTSLNNNNNNNRNLISDGDLHNKQSSLSQLEEQSNIFNSLSRPTDTIRISMEQSHIPPSSLPPITTSANTTTELPPLLTLLLLISIVLFVLYFLF